MSEVSLLYVDLQESIIDASRTQSPTAMRRAARAMAEVGLAFGWHCRASVIRVGEQPPPLISELRDLVLPGSIHLRSSFGALDDETLTDALRAARTERLIIAGVVTEVAVLQTVLRARDCGYHVDVILDASGGLSARTESAAIRQMEAVGATTTSVASLVTSLPFDPTTTAGGIALQALLGLLRAA